MTPTEDTPISENQDSDTQTTNVYQNKPCDRNYQDGGAHTVLQRAGVACCPSCKQPLSKHSNVNKTGHSVDEASTNVNSTMPVKPVSSKADYASEQDDKQLCPACNEENYGKCDLHLAIAEAQIQLVTELEGQKVEVEDAYGNMVEVVEVEVLKHKKQELERLQ